MRLTRRLRALLEQERGFTLVELLASMGILMAVMGGLTALMVSGTKSQIDLNNRFEAHTEARVGLDRFRREVHCASTVSTSSATSVTLATATCPAYTSGGNASVTWCRTTISATRYQLWRYAGASCSGTGTKLTDYLTYAGTQNLFTYAAPSGSTAAGTGSLATITILLPVNLTPARPERVYTLTDGIVLRNSSRPA